MKRLLCLLVLPILGAVLPLRAEETRYVLAPSVILSDPSSPIFKSASDQEVLASRFKKTFEASFGQHPPLSVEHPLDVSEPTLMVVPRLSAVRLNLDTVAGSLERYEAMIVGDITLMDPWTLTRLYAATRMVTRTVELSADRSDAEKMDFIRKAFRDAADAWLKECLAELQKNAHPFTLHSNILANPGISVRGGGGVWPFGSRQGVKHGSYLMSTQPLRAGRSVRVRELLDNFCIVEDPADPGRSLKADEAFRLTVVNSDSNAERAEPRVAIRWVGAPPTAPAGTGEALDADGWAGLMANYLSKDGRFRLLPMSTEKDNGAWRKMADKLRTFSLRADAIATQDITVLQAAEDPDIVVEIGLVNAYHGAGAGENGGTDHVFRAQWGVRWFERDAERNVLIFKGAEFIPEQTAVRTKRGLRELDLGSVWFSLCRNGIIRTADAVGKRLQPAERTVRGLGQGGGKIAWSGAAPGANARITWRRNQGQVKAADGKDLGIYWAKAQSLNVQDLSKVGKGDEVRFEPNACSPLAGFMAVDTAGSNLAGDSPWLQARLANALLKSLNADLVLGTTPDASCPQWLRLRVDNPTMEPTADALKVGGTFRLRLYRSPYDPNGEPAFKLGLQQTTPVPQPSGIRPADQGTALLAFQAVALEELSKRAIAQGLSQAISQGD